jgi:hypothetical protein
MGLQQQRQQPDNAQDHTHAHKAVPWMRWLIAVVILLLIVVGIIIWILIGQSSWTTILPVVIFTVLGVVIALFQWLFPVSTGAHTHEHTANSFPASLMPQLSTVSPAVATMPQIIVHVPPADHMSLPQSGPLDKAPYRGIMGVPPPTDPRTIQQREKAVRDVYTKLTQSDISVIALTGIGGVGKSTKEQAWECYWQALDITEEIGDQEGNSRVLRNISAIYLDEHRHDLALAALLLAKDALNEMQNPGRNKMQRDIDKLRNEIGDEQFEVLLTRIEPQAQQLMEQARQ